MQLGRYRRGGPCDALRPLALQDLRWGCCWAYESGSCALLGPISHSNRFLVLRRRTVGSDDILMMADESTDSMVAAKAKWLLQAYGIESLARDRTKTLAN